MSRFRCKAEKSRGRQRPRCAGGKHPRWIDLVYAKQYLSSYSTTAVYLWSFDAISSSTGPEPKSIHHRGKSTHTASWCSILSHTICPTMYGVMRPTSKYWGIMHKIISSPGELFCMHIRSHQLTSSTRLVNGYVISQLREMLPARKCDMRIHHPQLCDM